MNRKVTIIAEAGVNHNGNFELAKEMIFRAREAGADIVKFQTAVPELVMSASAPKAAYQLSTTDQAESQLEMAKAIHLPLSAYVKLKNICDEVGIRFLSTPFDLVSVDLLHQLKMEEWKIPSGEITNYPYLKKIASFGQPVILSTGMCTMGEIEAAIQLLTENGVKREMLTLLHCTTEYPAPYADINLRAMQQMREKFGVNVGYSDHSIGITVPVAAVALGATIIEKHFTLDKNMPGPDHKASLEPNELAEMVQSIRATEAALGDGYKKPASSEIKNMPIARKSIVAAVGIRKGEIFSEDNLTTKRPGSGISPMRWPEIIGQKAIKDFEPDELIVL